MRVDWSSTPCHLKIHGRASSHQDPGPFRGAFLSWGRARYENVVRLVFFPQATPAFKEIEKQFATEFDYRREAKNAQTIRANLLGNFPRILVPEVYLPLCTKRLLVMEEVYPSVPLPVALEAQAALMAEAAGFKGTTSEWVKQEAVKRKAEELRAAEKGKVAEGVSAQTIQAHIALQGVRQRLARWYQASVGWVTGQRYSPSPQPKTIMNVAKLVDELMAVHAHEVLIDGCFNGDPHPGNILYIQPEGNQEEKLALIDYGQVKVLPDEFRLKMAKTYYLVREAMKVETE
mmetsp:Transcript_10087/g.20196  ORF Transcript_10087/g.20196 Transcript_10087/m.20196 type:complete len:289 (-) Transcript_10087:243-1109(-)